jgi:23S rRNA C2498 (ribose-2'-O)-methylase RlmM
MSEAGVPRIVAHCRAGFEAEAAADLRRVAAAAETDVEVDAPVGRAFIVATPRTFDSQRSAARVAAGSTGVRPRAVLRTGPHQRSMPPAGKAGPIAWRRFPGFAQALRAGVPLPGAPRRAGSSCSERHLETPDTNDGKELSGVCKAIAKPLAERLRDEGAFIANAPRECRRCTCSSSTAVQVVGASLPPWGATGRWVSRDCGCPPARHRARR